MSVYNASQFALRRIRKEMESAHQCVDWPRVQKLDLMLADQLNEAFDDENRNTASLVNEMESILSLYSDMVGELDIQEQSGV